MEYFEIGLVIILILAVLFLSIRNLWRFVLEHCFRQYEEWRNQNIPQDTIELRNISITEDGKFQATLDHAKGSFAVYWKQGDSLEAILQQFQIEIRRLRVRQGSSTMTSDVSILVRMPYLSFPQNTPAIPTP